MMRILHCLRIFMFLLFLLSFVDFTKCQVKVIEPQKLARVFQAIFPPEGIIAGSTSLFGSPKYGETISARLVYKKSPSVHCSKDYFGDKDLPAKNSNKNDIWNRVVILVHRGVCPFVAKVRVAEDYGAVAVLFIDNKNHTANTVVSDDGHAGKIHIPSVLIDMVNGALLLEHVKKTDIQNPQDPNTVFIELTWEVPPGEVAIMDFWYSPSAEEGVRFLIEMAPLAAQLKEWMTVVPHLHIQEQVSLYPELCYDPLGGTRTLYCEDDPDGPNGPATGRQVVQEGVRQYCLHKLTKKAYGANKASAKSTNEAEEERLVAEYSQEFFDYLIAWDKGCSVGASEGRAWAKKTGKSVDDSFPPPYTAECSKKILKQIDLDEDMLDSCSTGQQAEDLLALELKGQAWDVVALRINGERFGGKLDASLAVRAVCTSFEAPPDLCNNPAEGFNILRDDSGSGSGMPWWGVLLIVLLVLAIVGVAFFFYKKYMEKNVRNSLRMEVMMEVKSQMQDYRRLPEDS